VFTVMFAFEPKDYPRDHKKYYKLYSIWWFSCRTKCRKKCSFIGKSLDTGSNQTLDDLHFNLNILTCISVK